MRKKDYELIAGSLRMSKEWNTTLKQDAYDIICENLANSFNRDNPKFDRQKFLTDCGIEYKTNNGVLESGTQAYL